MLAYVGCSEVYSQANKLISKLLGIEVNAMQIWRVTNTWGEQSSDIVDEAVASSVSVDAQEHVYAELDGAMVLTREDQWQEVKTGRIFKDTTILALSPQRSAVSSSLYASNLGNFEDFLAKFEPLVDVFDGLGKRLVILSDGAAWIRNWSKDYYPYATHILDYYHACEHLNTYLTAYLPQEEARKSLFQTWKNLLYEQGVQPIIDVLKSHQNKTKSLLSAQEKLLNYLTTNAYRMNYPEYLKRGLCIGSGAIEAAQRTVLQERMKRAGQRWSKNRAQNVLNLRVALLSDQWGKVRIWNTKTKNTPKYQYPS